MNYDPYRIRFYDRKFFAILSVSLAMTTPLMIAAAMPDYMGPFKGQKEFQERTVIVTGATGQLGISICQQYAKRKFRVIMACKNMEQCRIIRREIVMMSRNNAIACRHLDLEDIDSINTFANDIIQNEPHVNVLINNAAIKSLPEKQLTKYGIEKMYFVNFLAPYLLTFRLLDKLEKTAKHAGDSRIINILGKPKKDSVIDPSDINFDKRKYTSDAAYKQSKLALAYFTILLERHNREKDNNVYVYASSPCTNSIRDPTFRPSTPLEQFKDVKESFHKVSGPQISATATMCGIDPDMADRTKSGKLYTYMMRSWGWGAADRNDDLAKYVWNHAFKLLLSIADNSKKIEPEAPKDNENKVTAIKDDQNNKV